MEKAISIFDRIALGFLNLLVSLPTGVVLWVALNGFPWSVYTWLPAKSIIWFAIIMTLLGVVTNNVLLVNFYGRVWRVLVRWFSGY